MASAYDLIILIRPDSDFTLSAAAACLAASPGLPGLQVEMPTQKQLTLAWGSWRLFVCLEDYPWVEEESRELSEHFPDQSQVGAVGECTSRLSVWSEDPDPGMDHFNDWMISVETLT